MMRRNLRIASCLLLSLWAASNNAYAEIIVLESNVDGLRAGDRVERGRLENLLPEAKIKILDSETNKTFEFKGPENNEGRPGGLIGGTRGRNDEDR